MFYQGGGVSAGCITDSLVQLFATAPLILMKFDLNVQKTLE